MRKMMGLIKNAATKSRKDLANICLSDPTGIRTQIKGTGILHSIH